MILLFLSLITASLSVAYYFAIFLPSQRTVESSYKEDLEEVRNDVKRNANRLEEVKKVNNESTYDEELYEIKSALDEQERDSGMRSDCEATGGHYSGQGVCVF